MYKYMYINNLKVQKSIRDRHKIITFKTSKYSSLPLKIEIILEGTLRKCRLFAVENFKTWQY